MAFTGAAVVQHISDTVVRITGLSLAAAASGTIGLITGGAGEVDIDVPWNRYTNGRSQEIELDQSVEVSVYVAEAALAVVEPVSIVKSGDGPTDFLVTLANPDAAASGALEIYLKFHGA